MDNENISAENIQQNQGLTDDSSNVEVQSEEMVPKSKVNDIVRARANSINERAEREKQAVREQASKEGYDRALKEFESKIGHSVNGMAMTPEDARRIFQEEVLKATNERMANQILSDFANKM